ncbi:MAG: hypothetical protein L0Z50_39035 [Verrucomicrobiales bacterium]|nr:hypothetical protein [Verrucomicrobiales bacterium]
MNVVVRRAHLYLAMFLLPWFLMYGLTSLPFSHDSTFKKLFDPGGDSWTERFNKEYAVTVPEDESGLQRLGESIAREHGLTGAVGTYWEGKDRHLSMYVYSFWSSATMTYYPSQKRLVAKDRRFAWNEFLTGLHARGGYHHNSVLDDLWAVLVDVVCVSILIWIGTGLYMWWKVLKARVWGAAALVAGAVVFVLFVFSL